MKRKPEPVINMPTGSQPPAAVAAEKAILGMILGNGEGVADIRAELSVDDFFSPAHQKVYDAIVSLDTVGTPVDIVTVSESLRTSGDLESVGDMTAIADLLSAASDAYSLPSHVALVKEASNKRAVIRAAVEAMSACYSGESSSQDIMQRMQGRLDAVDVKRSADVRPVGIVTYDAAVDLHTRHTTKSAAEGLSTGWHDLDRKIGSLPPKEATILAGRPGMGKSTVMRAILLSHAMDDVGCLLVTPEENERNFAHGVIAYESNVNKMNLRSGIPSADTVDAAGLAVDLVRNRPLWVYDQPEPTVAEIGAILRRLQRKGHIGLLAIDHIGRLKSTSNAEKQNERTADTIRQIGKLAKRTGVHVLMLSQLNRMCEGRSDKRPMLSDLAESGVAEADAETVLLAFREEYYLRGNCPPAKRGMLEIIVAKARFGETGTVMLKADLSTGRVYPNVNGYGA